MTEPLTKSAKRATNDMAHGALAAIQELLDQGGIPRGTFADEQVQNLVALYNQRGDEIDRLRAALIEAARHLDNAAATARAYDDDDWYMQADSAAASARASAGMSVSEAPDD